MAPGERTRFSYSITPDPYATYPVSQPDNCWAPYDHDFDIMVKNRNQNITAQNVTHKGLTSMDLMNPPRPDSFSAEMQEAAGRVRILIGRAPTDWFGVKQYSVYKRRPNTGVVGELVAIEEITSSNDMFSAPHEVFDQNPWMGDTEYYVITVDYGNNSSSPLSATISRGYKVQTIKAEIPDRSTQR